MSNTYLLKRNYEQLASHLAQIMVGNTADADLFRGRTVRINLRIGHLVAGQGRLTFEAIPVQQLLVESKEQNDDMMSRVSSMSQMS